MAKKEAKKQNISVNTGEPIEEKDLELNPLAPLSEESAEDDDDELEIDDDVVDPFNDKWEK